MFGRIAVVVGRIRDVISGAFAGSRGRRAAGLALVVLLVTLSGYMAAAGGVTIDLPIGGPADGPTDGPTGQVAAVGGAGESGVGSPDAGNGTEAGIVAGATEGIDRDGDAILDRAEREIYGTDPTDRDTDGDGIPDGMEVACSAAYPDANPLRQDVYVELDSVGGADLDRATVERLRRTFADAPVANAGSESGIALHVVRSDADLPEGDSVNDDGRPGEYNDVDDYMAAHFQRDRAGYYYVLVATDVAYHGDDYYAGAGEPGVAIVESYDRETVMASLVLHELGHAFGIDGGQRGVDARTYSRSEYHSVMNYNALYDITTYSEGDDAVGRDEWAYVADDRYRPEIRTSGDALCPAVGG